jgi:O-antigen/teichoic acid export membrane protein
MGIIKRQAYAGTLLTYLGMAIGFITTALLFPKYLTTAEIGLLNIFLSYAYIFGQLATLGTGRMTIVFFPHYKDREKKHHGFFTLMMLIGTGGLILSMIILFLIKGPLVSNAHEKSDLFGTYYNYMYPLTIFTFVFLMLDTFNTALFNAIRGIFLKEFLQRLIILAAIAFFIIKWVNFNQFLVLFTLATVIPTVILFMYIFKHEDFRMDTRLGGKLRDKQKGMINIGINGIVIGFSGLIILNIDRIMVERLMGLGATGVYTTLAYFATLVSIPSRALMKIADPVIAHAWKQNDMDSLRENYYRSSLNQFLLGCLILIGIWGNIGNILRILPPEFAMGKWVVLFIGLAFLADMATGTATFVLANSKYFSYQTYYILLLVVLIIISNYLMIPVWGLAGAAIATCLSRVLTNMMRHRLLYKKFALQPYNFKFLLIILIAIIAYLPSYFLPEIQNLYLDIALRSIIIGGIFIILAVAFKISPDVNDRYKWLKSLILK